ncbi:hypothetical protein PLESTM_000166900 [Pleodorina starrii]|nr:hypothetical protein PLESTM_000166900 [Pleodorina starrii]
MADDIEAELEAQLASQREALTSINEAIDLGGEEAAGQEGHAELLQMRDELRAAVSELESALLEIKRARILQQLAAASRASPRPPDNRPPPADNPPPPAPAQALLPASAASGPPPRPAVQLPPAGSACHFRYMDGRWYAGRVQGPGRQAGTVSVAFQVPTRPFMLDPVDVMEALVRQCAVPTAAATTAASRGGPSSPQGPPGSLEAHEGAGGEVAVGRRALAQLPGCRLFVPVEIISLDAVQATATVMPLLPHPDGRRGGGGGVVVPLARVTRHAHVTPPAAVAAEGAGAVGAAVAGGDDAGEGAESDGGGSSSSSGSIRALLRPGMGDEEEEEGGGGSDGYHDDDDDDGGDDDDDDGEGDDDDIDLYGSDDDGGAGGVGAGRSRGAAASYGGSGAEGAEGGFLDVFGHARLAAAAGAVDDAALLAEWEAHGRGVASRLLVRMGYVRGRGLGSRGQGAMAAPEVLLLPERKGLGAADKDRLRRVGGAADDRLQGGAAKRRKRGGARQKRKRAIEAAREARAEAREAAEGAPGGGGLFDFINSSLGDSSAAARIRKAQVSVAGVAAHGGGGGGGGGGRAAQTAGAAAIAGAVAAAAGGGARRAPDRRGLMSHHDAVSGIQAQLSRLQEMLSRHRDNRGLRTQIEAQIRSVQAELAAAQSAAARASKAIQDKDAQKKWLKF